MIVSLSIKMADDSTSPATKGDLALLKGDFRALRDEMKVAMEGLEERLIHQFTLIAENLAHDFKGIFKDRMEQHSDTIEQHETRIQKLEVAVLR